MTIRNREDAARAAESKTSNSLGMCQAITRGYYMGPSAGDRDHDGDADANDGWLSEPSWARHVGDRKPPRGVPVYFRNASGRGHGHRAVSVGDHNGVIRSSDFSSKTKRYTPNVMGTGTIAEIERTMGLVYVGWSETITGQKIPLPAPPPPTRIDNFLKGGPQYDVKILDRAAKQRSDVKPIIKAIDAAVASLPKDKDPKSRVKTFVDGYKKDRVLRMGRLHNAVEAGRKGKVKKAYDNIQAQITKLKRL